jgi:hypothetical protein
MAYTTGGGTIIRIGVEGANTTEAQIDRVAGSMDRAGGAVGSLTQMFTRLAAPIAATAAAYLGLSSVVDGVHASIERLAQLDDSAQKTGSSVVESLSRLQKVAMMTGTDFGLVDKAIFNLGKTLGGTDEESKKARAALADLGITAKDIEEQDTAALFIQISKSLQDYQDSAGKSATLNGIFKKSAEDLAPFLNDVAENVGKFKGRTAESAAAASTFQDNLGLLKVRSSELWDTLAESLLPTLDTFTGKLADGSGALGQLTGYVDALAKDGTFKAWAEDAANAINALVAAVVPAAKITAAYFAIFVAAPALYSTVAGALFTLTAAVATYAMNVLIGQTNTIKFNTALFGTSVAAELAAGSLSKVRLAGNVLFAAFAGWEIGTWLREQFVEARVAGLAFVGAMLTGWEYVSYAAKMAWEGIKFTWQATLNTMRAGFAGYLSVVADGLAKIGAKQTADDVAAFAEAIRNAGGAQQTFAQQTAELTAEHHAALDAIDQNIVELVQYELSTASATTADAGAADQKKKNIKVSADNSDAIKKEAEAYAGLISGIKAKVAENRLELALGEDATDSQKASIKLDQELAAGKLVLTSAHLAAARSVLVEQASTEVLLKAQKTEKDVFSWIVQSTQARLASKAALESEYALYGQSSDARELANVGLKAEAELERFLADERKAGKTITEEMLGQLRVEKDLRVSVEQATLAQTKALSYAGQLHQENARFAAESILDEKARAAALLAIDADTWQQRIALTAEGTDARQKLEEEYATWYKNQLAKPQIDEQKKFWDSIDKTAHDTFVSIADGSKDVAQRLKDAFKNIFFDWLYQQTLKKWIISIGTSFGGGGAAGAVGGAASGTSSVLSAFGSATNLYSVGKTIFNGFNSGITSTIGGIATTFGNSIGSAAASAWGTGLTLTSTQAAEAAAAYTSAAATASAAGESAAASTYASTAGGLTGGAGAASAIPIIGWIIAGMAAADGFRKQGFDPNNGTTNALGQVAAPLPLFTNNALQSLGVSASLANILSGASLNTKLFGRANPVVERQGLQGTITAGGIDAENYADILEKGGIFRSDNRYEKTAAIDQGTDATFDSTVQAIAATIKGFGKSLGVEADQIDAYSKSFKVELTSDDVKNQELVAKLFGDFGDELANNLVPNLGALAAKGETASTTLQRVTGDFLVVQGALDALGVTSQQAFGAIGVASLAAREQLLKYAGGTEALASQVSYFTQNFLTSAEQLAPVQKQVNEQLASMGYSQLKTVDDYKKAVLDLASSGQIASESGAKTYAALLALAPAFKTVADATNEAQRDMLAQRADLQKELDGLTKTSVQLLAEQRAALDASNQSLFDQVQAAKAAKAAQDAAKTAIQGAIERTAAFADSMKKLGSDLLGGELSILNPMDKYKQSRAEYENNLTLARAGDVDAQGKLASLATAFLNASKAVNASSGDYTSDFIKIQNDAEAASKWASQQVDLGKATLDAYNKSIGVLADINAGVATVADAIRALADAGGFVKIAGSHESGLTRVPYDGYPMVAHEDEAVIDAPAMAAMRRYFGRAPSTGGGNQDAVVAEMKALRAEVAALRKEQAQQHGASVQANYDANNRAADKVNSGANRSATEAAWQKQSRRAATV